MSMFKRLFNRMRGGEEVTAPEQEAEAQPQPPAAPEPVEAPPEPEPEPLEALQGPEPEPLPQQPAARSGWLHRLRDGLSKSSRSLSTGITDIFTKRRLDAATLEELEDVLIAADLGAGMADRVSQAVAQGRYDKEIDPREVRRILARRHGFDPQDRDAVTMWDTSVQSLMFQVAGASGAVLAGALTTRYGPYVGFVVAAISLGIATVLLLRMQVSTVGRAPDAAKSAVVQ